MSRRVYLPTSSADLQTLLDGGALDVVRHPRPVLDTRRCIEGPGVEVL